MKDAHPMQEALWAFDADLCRRVLQLAGSCSQGQIDNTIYQMRLGFEVAVDQYSRMSTGETLAWGIRIAIEQNGYDVHIDDVAICKIDDLIQHKYKNIYLPNFSEYSNFVNDLHGIPDLFDQGTPDAGCPDSPSSA